MNVLVIPEDFRNDAGILEPIIKAMLTDCGKPNAKVIVCRDPLLGGISQALNSGRIAEIVERYQGMVTLFLLCVDRDGESGRQTRITQLEKEIFEKFGVTLIGENAWQEIEVWILAGHDDLPSEWAWTEIRKERDPKEKYYLPFAQLKNVFDQPAEGRKVLAQAAARRYNRIKRLCKEDVESLHLRIKKLLKESDS
jgi:hypothetical protein